MSSGVQVSKNGAVVGTGAAIDVRTVGFRPRRVELYNKAGLCYAVWLDTFSDGHMVKTVDSGAGTTDVADVTSNGITPLSDGFRIGTDADLNAAGEVIHWVAHE